MTDQQLIDSFCDKLKDTYSTFDELDDTQYSRIYDSLYYKFCDMAETIPQKNLLASNKYRIIERIKYGSKLYKETGSFYKKRDVDGAWGSHQKT